MTDNPRIVEANKEIIGCGVIGDCESCTYSWEDNIGRLRCGFDG